MTEASTQRMHDFEQRHVVSYLEDAATEGDAWKHALAAFDEQKTLLVELGSAKRSGLLDLLMRQWLPKDEANVQSQPHELLQALGLGRRQQESASTMNERNDVREGVEEFLANPSIEQAVPLMRRLNTDLSHSEQLGEFTRRLGRVTLHLSL